ncbi:MAG: lytic transglycosylase domain-containing protein [Verrucomicrobiota bacterium]
MFRWLSIFLVITTPISIALWWWSKTASFERQYDEIIRPIAEEQKMDPLLIRAVIWRESRFRPHMRGGDGERGLMQLMEIAAEDWARREKIQNFNPDQLYDPETNIRAGTWYLNRSIKRWAETDNPLIFGLAEYNAGRSNALRWVDSEHPESSEAFMRHMDFPTTQRYVLAITKKYAQYKRGYIQPPWVTAWYDWSAKIERRLKRNSPSPKAAE